MLISNLHIMLWLTVFEIFAVKWQKIGVWEAKNGPPEPLSWPHIWWPLKMSPPKGKKTILGHNSTIVQTFMLIGITFAETARAFLGRCRPPMTPVFSVISSFLYMFIFHVVLFIIIIIALCLRRVLVPSILPSKTVHRRDSLLNTWPNQFFCLCQMVFIKPEL